MVSKRSTRKSSSKKSSQTKKVRKLSGYMKFASKIRKDVLAEYPSMRSDVTQVAKEIGKRWRALSEAEKKRYA
jgi:hypothetical protein